MRDLRVQIEGRRLFVTPHAIERYIERVKPHMSMGAARVELGAVLLHAEVREVGWAGRPEQLCVVLADSICFPLQGVTLTSCLTRASVGEGVRETRNDRRPRHVDKRRRATESYSKSGRNRERARRDRRREKMGGLDG